MQTDDTKAGGSLGLLWGHYGSNITHLCVESCVETVFQSVIRFVNAYRNLQTSCKGSEVQEEEVRQRHIAAEAFFCFLETNSLFRVKDCVM